MKRWRFQLLLLLGLVTALPAIPTAWTVHVLFEEAVQPLLGDPFREGVRAGVESTRRELERERAGFLAELRAGADFDTLTPTFIAQLSEREQNTLRALVSPVGAPPVRLDLSSGSRWITRHQTRGGPVVWASGLLPDSLVHRAAQVEEATQRIESLRLQQDRLGRTLLATFLAAHGLVVVLAISLGLFLVRRWTEPLASLGQAIESVAGGNLGIEVVPDGNEEMRRLLERFNRMVAELRTQRAELARMEKRTAWQQMARSLAHEIKNPLTPIQLAAQEIRTAYDGSDPRFGALVEEGTQIVEEEVERLRLLVQGFSQLARPPKSFASVDLNELATEVERTYGDKVRCHLHPSAALVEGDRDALRRVFLNLVNNALEAESRPDGTLRVEITIRSHEGPNAGGSADRTGRRPEAGQSPRPEAEPSPQSGAWRPRDFVVEFRDHGPGIDPGDRERVFEPDFTTRSDGIGLGLAIARSAAEAHGGSLELGVASPGAKFLLVLPASPFHDSRNPEAP